MPRNAQNTVGKNLWLKRNQAHRDSMKDRKFSSPGVNQKNQVDVLNDYHGYCVACHLHIYSRSDSNDEASYFISHINSEEHWNMLRTFPENGCIFEPVSEDLEHNEIDYWKCNACEKILELSNKQKGEKVDLEIENHEKTEEHLRNYHLMMDPMQSLLVAVAFTPDLYQKSSSPKCQICSPSDPSESGTEQHIKSPDHLEKLAKYLETEYKTSLNAENLRTLFEKLRTNNETHATTNEDHNCQADPSDSIMSNGKAAEEENKQVGVAKKRRRKKARTVKSGDLGKSSVGQATATNGGSSVIKEEKKTMQMKQTENIKKHSTEEMAFLLANSCVERLKIQEDISTEGYFLL